MIVEVVDTDVANHLTDTDASMMAQTDIKAMDRWHHVCIELSIGVSTDDMGYVTFLWSCM